MELDELLRKEGLAAGDVRDTLAWARERAEELVSGLVADAELGPLLDEDFTSPPLPRLEPSASPEADGMHADAQTEPAGGGHADGSPPASADDIAPPTGGVAPDEPAHGLLTNGAAAQMYDEDSDVGERLTSGDPDVDALAAGLIDAPQPVPRSSTEPTPVDAPSPMPPAEHTEPRPVDADGPSPISADTADALSSLPPPPMRPDLPEVGPGVEAGPMADAAYDQGSVATQMPEADAPSLEPGVTSLPPPAGELEEVTQPRAVPPTDPDAGHSGAIEIDDEEIELLDDDDLELVEDDDDAPAAAEQPSVEPLAPIDDGSGASDASGQVPEWQAALNSAAMGGGAQADQDSGLYGMPKPPPEAEPAHPEAEPAQQPVAEDESMDIDLGDL